MFGLFLLIVLVEIVGCYLLWLWLCKGGSVWLLLLMVVSLVLFVWLLILYLMVSGWVYVVYGGVYIGIVLFWLWLVEGICFSCWDLLGVVLCLVGMVVIMFGLCMFLVQGWVWFGVIRLVMVYDGGVFGFWSMYMFCFVSFCEFYLFYFSEYCYLVLWWLYFIGSCGVLLLVVIVLLCGQLLFLFGVLFCGYGFVWVGYFFFEKNRLVMFCYLLYLFMGDWVMFFDILCGWVCLQWVVLVFCGYCFVGRGKGLVGCVFVFMNCCVVVCLWVVDLG